MADAEADTQYQLRSMTRHDLPEIMRIERGSYQLPWSEKIFADCLEVGYHTLVAEAADQLHGFVVFSVAVGESHILNLCVDPAHRHCGIAEALMQQTIASAMVHGAQTMFLEVRVSNRAAVALYKKLLFVETGCRKNYYNVAGENNRREDALLMARVLTI
ncbi:MAG: ribosomal protein S18-alanine N-acetyltransferase [Pseudomonadota bacterium]